MVLMQQPHASSVHAVLAPHSKVWSQALNLRHVLQSLKQSNKTLEAEVQLEKQRTASTEKQLAE